MLRSRRAQLLFDIFDVDKRGKVTMAELDAMIRMLYGSADADPEVLRLLAVNGSADEDALTFNEFLQVWFCGCFYISVDLFFFELLFCRYRCVGIFLSESGKILDNVR